MSKFSFLVAVTLLLSLRVSVFCQNSIVEEMSSRVGAKMHIADTVLNGFDKYGISIGIENYSAQYKDFPSKQIQNQVELRLRQAKVKINNKERGINRLVFNYMPVVLKSGRLSHYVCSVEALRPVTFVVDNITYLQTAKVWDDGGSVAASQLRDSLNDVLDEFLLELMKSREEHEKNKKALAAKNKSAAKPSSATPAKK